LIAPGDKPQAAGGRQTPHTGTHTELGAFADALEMPGCKAQRLRRFGSSTFSQTQERELRRQAVDRLERVRMSDRHLFR
jgi:hypothetical protein